MKKTLREQLIGAWKPVRTGWPPFASGDWLCGTN